MFKFTKLITLHTDADTASRDRLAAALDAAGAAAHVLQARLKPTLPGAANGGDLIWLAQFAAEADYREWLQGPAGRAATGVLSSETVRHVDSVAYRQGPSGVAEPGLRGGVHRTLLLSVSPLADLKKITQFEAEMREMAYYIPAIRNWGFSRVLVAGGARQWTHVWEQEFRDLAGLRGPYMRHPYHFAHIDRWFDPEATDGIIDGLLCHTFCAFDTSMLTTA